MSRLDALRLTRSLKKRLVDFNVSSNALRDPQAMEACRRIWDASGDRGGLASELWVEGSIPHRSSEKTLMDAAREHLFSGKLADHLYRRGIFNDDMKLHHHQWQALERTARQTNPAIVVSAGTGAGKTESFLLPLLSDLMGRPRTDGGGCRAIILYPMNALVNDQVDRLYDWLKGQRELTLCHFTSETPEDKGSAKGVTYDACRYRTRAHARGLEDANGRALGGKDGTPRGQVPDILITNYSMLEYMLCRPQDSVFFGRDLRAVVLDEAHLYTSTLAAEVTLLLRRLYDKCGLRSEDVCQYATSATIATGPRQEKQRQLREFASTLFSKPPEMVHPILGLQATSSLPLPEPPAQAPAPGLLLETAVDIDTIRMPPDGKEEMVIDPKGCRRMTPMLEQLISAEKVAQALSTCNDQPARLLLALRYSPQVHHLEQLLRSRKQKLTDLAQHLWGDESEESQEATVLLLNLCASARESLGAPPLIPHRLHQMLRPSEGFSVCCNPSCGEADFPGLGKLYPGRQERCECCDALCLSLFRCQSCGEHMVAGSTKAGRIQTPAVADPDIFFSLMGGTPKVLDFRKGREAGHGARIEGLNCFRCSECPRCGEASRTFRPIQSATSVVLSILAETMLAELPPIATQHVGTNEYLPARGRRLLAFSDSRAEAAALGPRLRHQHEIQLVRAAIVKVFQETPTADPEVLESYREDIKELEDKLNAGKVLPARQPAERERLAGLKAQLGALLKGGSVESWASSLVRRPEIAQLLEEETGDFHQADSWDQRAWLNNASRIRQHGIRLLGRELFRVPRRAVVTVETIGCVEVVFPELESLSVPSSLLGELLTETVRAKLREIWPDLLAALVDSIRYDGATTFGSDQEDRLWFLEGRVPGRWEHRRNFVGATEGHRRRVFITTVLERIGLEDAQDNAVEVLEAVFDQLREHATVTKDGVRHTRKDGQFAWLETDSRQGDHGNEPALRVIFPELALRKPAALFQSSTSGRVWPRQVKGCAPEAGEKSLVSVTLEALDESPLLGRFRRELASSSPVFENGLWAEEHSAQLSPKEARRRQELFKIGARNILSATTTLELGIDIGGLSGTFLSNVPPGLANYLQRAGRVGRRADGSSIVVTCARSRPFDREVFRDIGRFLTKPLRRPLVLMGRHRIVARHFHAWLMNQFFTQLYPPGEWVGAMAAFGRMGSFSGQPLPPRWESSYRPQADLNPVHPLVGASLPTWWKDHESGGLARNFLDWIDAIEANLEQFRPRLNSMFKDTPLTGPGVTWTSMLSDAREVFEKGLGRWVKDYEALLATWKEATRADQANAIRYQLRVLYDTTVIESMANARFLPRYGFPIGVHNLKVIKTDEKGKTREEDQFRLSRPGVLALREYVPGSQLLVGGKLVTSRGILKHWTGANLDEAMGLRGGAAKCSNEHAFYWFGEPMNCPQCDGKPIGIKPLLFPSHGFTTAAWDPPRRSADIERVGKVITGTIAFANRGRGSIVTQSLAGVSGLQAIYQEEADMVVYNHGEHDRGFAICTHCGYADSEPEKGSALPSGFERHLPLLAEKGAPCWKKTHTPALRYTSLAAKEPTDMLLLDLAGFLGSDAANKELVVSLAIAFRLAGARLLELDSRELGEMVVRVGPAWGAVIYDNVPGGAGHVLELMNRGPQWLENVRDLLYVNEGHHNRCRTACLDCVLTFDAQSYFNDPNTPLDRRRALEWVEQMLARRTASQESDATKPVPEEALDLSDLEDFVDPSCLHLLDICRRGLMPRPEVGYELMEDNRIKATAELAWLEQRTVLVLEEESAEAFREAGWKVYFPDELEREFATVN